MTTTLLLAAIWLQQTPTPVTPEKAPTDPISGLLSYGVLGIVVILLLTGLLVPGYLYKRTEKENDRLRSLIDEKVYPAIEASTSATREAQETMRDVVQTLANVNALAQYQQQKPAPRPRPRKKT